jgi:general secretion pathway protein L
MLPELFFWWREQMRDLFAPVFRRASSQTPDALVIEADTGVAGYWHVARRSKGVSMRMASLTTESGDDAWHQALAPRRRGEPVVIRLAQSFLHRLTPVPAAAATHLDRWLRYEMDRLTPFSAEDVIYLHRVRSRDRSAGTLLVDVVLLPRAWVNDVLRHLESVSIRPIAIESPESSPSDGALPRRIPLDRNDGANRARERMAWSVGVGACAVLAAIVIALPLARQSLALADVADQLAALREPMRQVDALRQRIASGSAGTDRIAAARERGTAALRALGVLTDLIPDDTYLTSVSLRPDHLTIEGRSAAATKLIASMAAEPNLRNPAFAAPVMRGDNGTEIFTIEAGFGS